LSVFGAKSRVKAQLSCAASARDRQPVELGKNSIYKSSATPGPANTILTGNSEARNTKSLGTSPEIIDIRRRYK